MPTHGELGSGHLTYKNLWIGIIKPISQMRKSWLTAANLLAAEIRTPVSLPKVLHSLTLQFAFTEGGHRFNWFFFQHLLCGDYALRFLSKNRLRQLIRTGEIYLVFLERCSIAFCAVRQGLSFLHVSPLQIGLQICTLQPTHVLPLTFKSCPWNLYNSMEHNSFKLAKSFVFDVCYPFMIPEMIL